MQLEQQIKPFCLKSEAGKFIGLLGKAHVLHIMYILGESKVPIRFNELKRRLNVTSTTLSRRLEDLEEVGVVSRKLYAEVPLRVEYKSTKVADDIRPILANLFEWIERSYPNN